MQQSIQQVKKDVSLYSESLSILDPKQRAWIEVDGQSIENNVRKIRSILKPNCQFMAVVKADGYGHDALFVSKSAIKGGADQLGVATLQEGINLREAGITIPILVLGNIYDEQDLFTCFKYKLMPTISNFRECLVCNNIGKKYKEKYKIHLKVDSGMSRLGFEIDSFIAKFKQIESLENTQIEGIYSHFSSADEDNIKDKSCFTIFQHNRFKDLLNNLTSNKLIKIHLANSAATFLSKEFHYDMVRVGLAMYGYNPTKESENLITLEPALLLKSKISFIRTIDKNIRVSYGGQFITKRKTKLAVISIGYADGVNRKLSNQINIIHGGKTYPQVGAITMDQLMVDITESDNIKVGDTVILLGSEGDSSISPVEWAHKSLSITWEILCGFKNRLPRVQV